ADRQSRSGASHPHPRTVGQPGARERFGLPAGDPLSGCGQACRSRAAAGTAGAGGHIADPLRAKAADRRRTIGAMLQHRWWYLRALSLPEWRLHPWRHMAVALAVAVGVALAFSVHL